MMVRRILLNPEAKKWMQLAACILSIYLFIFIFAPAIQTLPYIRDFHHFVRAHDIDASALFYTEIDEFGDVDVSVRSAMNYSSP